jgi:hypothetical protein
MDWIADTLDSFGRACGVPGLALDEEGCLCLSIDEDRLLTLRDLAPAGSDEVLVILQAAMPFPHGSAARCALLLADFRRSAGPAPQLAMEGDDLIATLRIPRNSFVHSALEEAVSALLEFHRRVAQAEPEAALP